MKGPRQLTWRTRRRPRPADPITPPYPSLSGAHAGAGRHRKIRIFPKIGGGPDAAQPFRFPTSFARLGVQRHSLSAFPTLSVSPNTTTRDRNADSHRLTLSSFCRCLRPCDLLGGHRPSQRPRNLAWPLRQERAQTVKPTTAAGLAKVDDNVVRMIDHIIHISTVFRSHVGSRPHLLRGFRRDPSQPPSFFQQDLARLRVWWCFSPSAHLT